MGSALEHLYIFYGVCTLVNPVYYLPRLYVRNPDIDV